VLDVYEGDSVLTRLINVYHEVVDDRHTLQCLFDHDLDELTPTLVVGDFNTHSHRWSLPGHEPSSWVGRFDEWLDANGLSLLNPLHVPTWRSARTDMRPIALIGVIGEGSPDPQIGRSWSALSLPITGYGRLGDALPLLYLRPFPPLTSLLSGPSKLTPNPPCKLTFAKSSCSPTTHTTITKSSYPPTDCDGICTR